MKTTNLPAAAFQSAMESAAEKVNNKPALKSVSDDMKKTAPLPKPAGKVIEVPVETVEQPADENCLPKAIHEFAEKYNLVVTDKKSNKKAVRCEVWQFVLEQKGITPTFDSEYCEAGVITTCHLLDSHGIEISRSSTIASKTESFLANKPAYAVWGMSQTRALARAAKNVYGHLVVMAGYSATPSDEMDFDDAPTPASSEGAVTVSSEDEIARLAGRKN